MRQNPLGRYGFVKDRDFVNPAGEIPAVGVVDSAAADLGIVDRVIAVIGSASAACSDQRSIIVVLNGNSISNGGDMMPFIITERVRGFDLAASRSPHLDDVGSDEAVLDGIILPDNADAAALIGPIGGQNPIFQAERSPAGQEFVPRVHPFLAGSAVKGCGPIIGGESGERRGPWARIASGCSGGPAFTGSSFVAHIIDTIATGGAAVGGDRTGSFLETVVTEGSIETNIGRVSHQVKGELNGGIGGHSDPGEVPHAGDRER